MPAHSSFRARPGARAAPGEREPRGGSRVQGGAVARRRGGRAGRATSRCPERGWRGPRDQSPRVAAGDRPPAGEVTGASVSAVPPCSRGPSPSSSHHRRLAEAIFHMRCVEGAALPARAAALLLGLRLQLGKRAGRPMARRSSSLSALPAKHACAHRVRDVTGLEVEGRNLLEEPAPWRRVHGRSPSRLRPRRSSPGSFGLVRPARPEVGPRLTGLGSDGGGKSQGRLSTSAGMAAVRSPWRRRWWRTCASISLLALVRAPSGRTRCGWSASGTFTSFATFSRRS